MFPSPSHTHTHFTVCLCHIHCGRLEDASRSPCVSVSHSKGMWRLVLIDLWKSGRISPVHLLSFRYTHIHELTYIFKYTQTLALLTYSCMSVFQGQNALSIRLIHSRRTPPRPPIHLHRNPYTSFENAFKFIWGLFVVFGFFSFFFFFGLSLVLQCSLYFLSFSISSFHSFSHGLHFGPPLISHSFLHPFLWSTFRRKRKG